MVAWPVLSREDIDATRLSTWYQNFENVTFGSVTIDLDEISEKEAFLEWLNSDSIFLPVEAVDETIDETQDQEDDQEGVNGSTEVESLHRMELSRSRSSSSSSSSSFSEPPKYHLPKLTLAIRNALQVFDGTCFPKLNWTAPRDAAYMIPQSQGPLRCTTPADIYLLLKSSDLIQHDLDPYRAYSGCDEHQIPEEGRMKIEIVLRRFEEIVPSREFRCFVLPDRLIGISQRDTNYYDHLQGEENQDDIKSTILNFFNQTIKPGFQGGKDYIFDVYLSANLSTALLVDINPFRPSTDLILFEYPDLFDLAEGEEENLPIFRVIDSQSHPSANRLNPEYQSNRMPLELTALSEGRTLTEFEEAFKDSVRVSI